MCELSMDQFLIKNKEWSKKLNASNPAYFQQLAEGQSPKALLLGCSDSRVSPSQVLGAELGEFFIHRNIANVVSHADMNFLSVMQYAIEVLKIEHIIVYGHYGCGGIKAALSNDAHGLIDNWLANIRDVINRNKEELNACKGADCQVNRLVELNVLAQIENIKQTSVYKEAIKHGHNIKLHPWVFDFSTGLVHDLAGGV